MGELLIIGKKAMILSGESIEGELKINWRKDNREEIGLAEKTFKEHVSRGWFAIGEKSGEMTQIFAFNPTFDRIVLSPIAVGG